MTSATPKKFQSPFGKKKIMTRHTTSTTTQITQFVIAKTTITHVHCYIMLLRQQHHTKQFLLLKQQQKCLAIEKKKKKKKWFDSIAKTTMRINHTT